MMTKTTRINWVIGGLLLFVLAAILYFNSILTPTSMDAISSNAGTPTENQAPSYVAQFKADCILPDGREVLGTVSVPSNTAPDDLDIIEVKTEGGPPVSFKKDQGRCVYAPY